MEIYTGTFVYMYIYIYMYIIYMYINTSSFLHALVVLHSLPKLKSSMVLVFSADFLYTFFIKIFLTKYPIH